MAGNLYGYPGLGYLASGEKPGRQPKSKYRRRAPRSPVMSEPRRSRRDLRNLTQGVSTCPLTRRLDQYRDVSKESWDEMLKIKVAVTVAVDTLRCLKNKLPERENRRTPSGPNKWRFQLL